MFSQAEALHSKYDLLNHKDARVDYKFHLGRGIGYYDSEQYDLALPEFSKAIFIDPGQFEAHAYRGMTNYKLKKFACAISDIDQYMAIPESPYRALVYYRRACMHFDKAAAESLYVEGIGEAIWDLIKACDHDPSFKKAETKLNGILTGYSNKILFRHIRNLSDEEKQDYVQEKLKLRGIVESETVKSSNNKRPWYAFDVFNRDISRMDIELKDVVEAGHSQVKLSSG